MTVLDVVGYEGKYRVSDKGDVFGIYDKGGPMKPFKRYGRDSVHLSNDGQRSKFYVHRLVAEAHLPNPENKPIVHHIDGDHTNNAVDNLMWVTEEEHKELHTVRLFSYSITILGFEFSVRRVG